MASRYVESELLTVAETAIELRVSSATVKRWARNSQIDHVRTPGGQIRIPVWALPRMQHNRLPNGERRRDRRAAA